MTRKEYESLLAEAIKPDTTGERRREIGDRLLIECGDTRLGEALDLMGRAQVDVGIQVVVTDIGYDPIEDRLDVTTAFRQVESGKKGAANGTG